MGNKKSKPNLVGNGSPQCVEQAMELMAPGPCGWANVNYQFNFDSKIKPEDMERLARLSGAKWCQVNDTLAVRTQVNTDKDRTDCCLGKLGGAWWCGNQNCPVSPSCSEVLDKECKKPENLKLPVCQQWCGRLNNSACDKAASEYCGTPENPGKGADDPFCYCYQSPFPLAAACFDRRCTTQGYKNEAMKKQMINCPMLCGAITVCDPGAGDCVLDGNRYEIYCGQLDPTDYIVAWLRANPIMAGVGVLLLFVLLVLILGNMFGKKSK